MILGLRTAIYPVPDMQKGKEWYSAAFGATPYFEQPPYIGFAIGGFELGLIPDGQPGPTGSRVYWGVDNIEAEVERLLALGATVHSAIQEVGEGIKVAELNDPYGNVLGLIYNPVFKPEDVR